MFTENLESCINLESCCGG